MTTTTPPRPRGRPPKPEGAAASVRLNVYLTPAQVVQLDTARGKVSRSEWLASKAGLR